MPTLRIPTQPSNPLNYLACCGIFDLVSRLDPQATAHWHCTAPLGLHITTSLPEPELYTAILDLCRRIDRWLFITVPGQTDVWQAEATLIGFEHTHVIALDWWQETVEATGAIDKKSAWKMYAGQQTIEGITSDMIALCSQLAKPLLSGLLSDLLAANAGMTGRFGFDPRSTRSALDVGYSPNDLGLPVATYPFAELLAAFGLQSFFPGRCGIPGRLASTRAWYVADGGSAFLYRLWQNPLPIALARVAATADAFTTAIPLQAPRATRKNYSNLTQATIR